MENRSGIYPSGDRVLIKPDEIEEVTKGGIVLPDKQRRDHQNAQTSGVLVAVGPDAWSDYKAAFAGIGDKVMFAKYGGLSVIGKDGKRYRVINDIDVTAIIDEGVTFNDFEARERYG